MDLVTPLTLPQCTGPTVIKFGFADDAVNALHTGLKPLDVGVVVVVAATGPGVNRLVITLVQSLVTKTEFFRNGQNRAQRAGAAGLRA